MTPEQLQKGKELAVKIKELEDQLKGWADAKGWYHKTMNLSCGGFVVAVDTKYINFDVIKTLTVARVEKELNELKQEFINL